MVRGSSMLHLMKSKPINLMEELQADQKIIRWLNVRVGGRDLRGSSSWKTYPRVSGTLRRDRECPDITVAKGG